jgi:Ran GTPase-activating protein (RanGAP) involved in mRNA processing and transport
MSSVGTTLVVRSFHDSPSPTTALKQAMQDKQICNVQLLSIIFRQCTADALVELLQDGRDWKTVKLIRCKLNRVDDPRAMMMALQYVERVEFSWTWHVHDLKYALATTKEESRLQTLVLRETHLADDTSLEEGLSRTQSLKELEIHQVLLHPLVEYLTRGLQQNVYLERLDLSCCKLPDENLAELVRAAFENNPYLTTLNIAGNECGPLGLLALGTIVQCADSNLKTLNLSRQGFSSIAANATETEQQGFHNIGVFAEALAVNSTLIRCDLSRNELTNDDAAVLGRALAQNRTLYELNLSFNKIGDEGMQQFSFYVPSMCVRRLSIKPNPLGNVGAQYLLDAMKENVHIEFLDSLLGLDLDCTRQLRLYAHLNRGGRRILQAENVVLGLWPILLDRATTIPYYSDQDAHVRATVLFHLLQNGADQFLVQQR